MQCQRLALLTNSLYSETTNELIINPDDLATAKSIRRPTTDVPEELKFGQLFRKLWANLQTKPRVGWFRLETGEFEVKCPRDPKICTRPSLNATFTSRALADYYEGLFGEVVQALQLKYGSVPGELGLEVNWSALHTTTCGVCSSRNKPCRLKPIETGAARLLPVCQRCEHHLPDGNLYEIMLIQTSAGLKSLSLTDPYLVEVRRFRHQVNLAQRQLKALLEERLIGTSYGRAYQRNLEQLSWSVEERRTLIKQINRLYWVKMNA